MLSRFFSRGSRTGDDNSFQLSSDINPNFLIGQEVYTLYFDDRQIELYLDNGVRMRIQGSFEHYRETELLQHYDTYPPRMTKLLSILMSPIAKFNSVGDKAFQMHLENGESLIFKGYLGIQQFYTK